MALYLRTNGLVLLVCALLTNCGTTRSENVTQKPHELNQRDDEISQVSFFTGEEGGFKLSDFMEKDPSINGLPVNALLWRAALDVASFVPLDDVDTFGGSIVTEWHQPKDSPDKRLKLTVFVIGRELRSDAVTVRTYVQNRVDSEWVDAGRDEALGRKLEDLVLTRARELRAATSAKTVN